MSNWKTEADFSTIDALHQDLSFPQSKYHDPSLKSTEEEILAFFTKFGDFINRVAHDNPTDGKQYFEMTDYIIWDLMGAVVRPNLEPHYDHITPYLGKTKQNFKDVEIVAVTKDFGYIIAVQRVSGTAADGSPYDMTYRTTSLVRKVDDGTWKYIHEHYSFPVDMATKVADFSGTQKAEENVEFTKK